MEKTTRREMLVTLGAAAGGVLLAACGGTSGGDGGSGEDAGGGGGSCDSVSTEIAANHGHMVTVPPADVLEGAMTTYELVGASHTHHVTLSADDFANLAAGQTVMILTTTDADHDHEVTFRCG
jgi:hypothetical protein